MKTRTRGFTLIELMIVIAIIAILAAIAVPAYRDYTIRAKLSEGFSAAMSVKNSVVSAYASNGLAGIEQVAATYPTTNASTGSKYVRWIEVDDGGVITAVISATPANGLPADIDGQTFTLTPQLATAAGFIALGAEMEGHVDWACASSVHVVAQGRGMLYTDGTLPGRYLPAECR